MKSLFPLFLTLLNACPQTVWGPFHPHAYFSVWSSPVLTCVLVSSTVGGPSTSGAMSPSCLCCSLLVPWPSTPGNLTSNYAWTSYGQCRSGSVCVCFCVCPKAFCLSIIIINIIILCKGHFQPWRICIYWQKQLGVYQS